MTTISATRLGHITIVILLAFYGVMLWQKEIIRKTEARYAVTTATMLEAGDYLTPHFRGRLRLAKPPLPYWAIMLSSLGGQVTAFSATLPAVLAILLTALLLYGIGRRVVSTLAGGVAAIVCLTLPGMVGIGQEVSGDIFVVLFNAVAFVCYWRSREAVDAGLSLPPVRADALPKATLVTGGCAGGWWWEGGMWLAFGLAFLAKGPPGLCGILPIIITSLVLREWRYWCRWRHGLGALLAVFVGGGWYVLMMQMHPEAGAVFHAEMQRGANATHHIAPWYYYFKKLPAAVLPWGVLLPFAWWQARRETNVARRHFMLYCAIWLVAGFVLFSLFKAKRSYYTMPVYIPIGLCVGYWLDAWSRRPMVAEAPLKAWRFCLVAAASALLIGAGGAVMKVVLAVALPRMILASGVATGLFVGYQVWAWQRYRAGQLWQLGAVYGVWLPLIALAVLAGQPAYQQRKSVQPFTDGVNELLPPAAPVYLYLIGTPVYDFYCARRPLYIDQLQPLYERVAETGVAYVMLLEKNYAALKNAAPKSQRYRYDIPHHARYPHAKNKHEVIFVRIQLDAKSIP